MAYTHFPKFHHRVKIDQNLDSKTRLEIDSKEQSRSTDCEGLDLKVDGELDWRADCES